MSSTEISKRMGGTDISLLGGDPAQEKAIIRAMEDGNAEEVDRLLRELMPKPGEITSEAELTYFRIAHELGLLRRDTKGLYLEMDGRRIDFHSQINASFADTGRTVSDVDKAAYFRKLAEQHFAVQAAMRIVPAKIQSGEPLTEIDQMALLRLQQIAGGVGAEVRQITSMGGGQEISRIPLPQGGGNLLTYTALPEGDTLINIPQKSRKFVLAAFAAIGITFSIIGGGIVLFFSGSQKPVEITKVDEAKPAVKEPGNGNLKTLVIPNLMEDPKKVLEKEIKDRYGVQFFEKIGKTLLSEKGDWMKIKDSITSAIVKSGFDIKFSPENITVKNEQIQIQKTVQVMENGVSVNKLIVFYILKTEKSFTILAWYQGEGDQATREVTGIDEKSMFPDGKIKIVPEKPTQDDKKKKRKSQ